jgi:CubicO group peptidase (beta-lactamase class C family)
MRRHLSWFGFAAVGVGICVLAGLAFAALVLAGLTRTNGYDWDRATPESQGIDGARLDTLRQDLEAKNTSVFLVVRNGQIVYEWYQQKPFSGSPLQKFKNLLRRTLPRWKPEYQRNNLGAMAKLLTSSLVLMTAVEDRNIHLDDPGWKYIPAWKDDPVRSGITIRHLATQTSGIENVKYPDEQEGWKGEFSRNPGARFSLANSTAPVLYPPGTHYVYSSTGYYSLHYALSASLKESSQPDIRELLRERIMKALGMPDASWQIGDGHTYDVDGMKLYAISARYTARTVAQLGQLLLQSGNWKGRQILEPDAVNAMLTYAGGANLERPENTPGPTHGAWSNYDGLWPALPHDAVVSAGAGHKMMLIVPSLNLIVIRFGGSLDGTVGATASGGPYFEALEENIFNPVMAAIIDTPSAKGQN